MTNCAGDPRVQLTETLEKARQLVDFLLWRYCFSMDCSLVEWKERLIGFADSRELFPLPEAQSYGAYLQEKFRTGSREHRPISSTATPAMSSSGNLRVPERPRISFCTTCMGRLHYLCQTLPENLAANKQHSRNIEFILLDYNSNDGLREWIRTAMSEHTDSGLLTVYATNQPSLYHSAHAKNIAHRLATGEIVCNVDADNFIVPGLVEFIWGEFLENPNVIIYGKGRDATGRVTILRKHFFEMGGYNEEMQGYGYDDVDLIKRSAQHLTLRTKQISEFTRFIAHSHEERARNSEFNSISESNEVNRRIMMEGLDSGPLVANTGTAWGRAMVRKNYRGEPFPSDGDSFQQS